MEQEKLRAALIKVRDNIQAMGPEKFREQLENTENGDIYHALSLLQDFSEFLYEEEQKNEKQKTDSE